MSKLIKNLLLFFLGFVPIFLLGVYLFVHSVGEKYIPPARISNSVSYNDKIKFCNESRLKENITIGSSMSLNNVHSESIINFLHSDNYLNTASWGTKIYDNYNFLREYLSVKKVSTIFMLSSINDFAKSEISYDVSNISNVLTTDKIWFYYVKYPDIQYYVTNVNYYKMLKTSDTLYESLIYDKYGQVKYKINDFAIDSNRWNNIVTDIKLDEINYMYLDSTAKLAKNNKINFYYIISSYRKGIYGKVDKGKLLQHTKRVKNILNKYNYNIVDTNDQIWPDSLFVDATHMTDIGAKILTDYFLSKITVKKDSTFYNVPLKK